MAFTPIPDLNGLVDRRVTEANRALLSLVYKIRLKQIARLSKQMMKSPYVMGSPDIERLIKINDIAEAKP